MRADQRSLSIVIVDEVCVASLARLVGLGPAVRTIQYCEPVRPAVARLVALLRRLGLLHATLEPIAHHVGQIRDECGHSAYVQIQREARLLCTTLSDQFMERDPLLFAMRSTWEASKLRLHFDLLLERIFLRECSRINLVSWLVRSEWRVDPVRCLLVIAKRPWHGRLQAYAQTRQVRLVGYRPLWGWSAVAAIGAYLQDVRRWSARLLAGGLTALRQRLRDTVSRVNGDGPVCRRSARRGTVAIRYWYRSLDFDPLERSEFFWLESSGIPSSDVLLYDYDSTQPLDEHVRQQLIRRGVRLLGRGPGVQSWTPTWRMVPVLLRALGKLLGSSITLLASGRHLSGFVFSQLRLLAVEYAYWYDFFATNQVVLNVSTMNTSAAQMLALDASGAVSAAYQYSVSNILVPTSLLCGGGDVQFVFSPTFARLWHEARTSAPAAVPIGFVYDGAFAAIRARGRWEELRQQLTAHGASVVVCFFDENTVNRWDICASDDDAQRDYRFVLHWVLDDPTVGLICKPKKSTNLFGRIGPLAELLEQARRTGRFLVLTSDTIGGGVFPAEAALAADVCVGKLLGGSAAFEARLIGKPTLLVDVEGFRTHPFHAWGRGRVVFDDWPSLRAAVERYRVDPTAVLAFGDWSPALNAFDPFQDGQATERMGRYLFWITEAFADGLSKSQALAYAARQFQRRWGIQLSPRPGPGRKQEAPLPQELVTP